ncbi:hypothetical protein JYP52_21395 [Nitratireductor aquibiodomus]|uniref:hypothetical protein n=1 Tax=Nitratireductor TaxID=245876 RepID=UPI000DE077D6|nr:MULTISPECIES: hypothetical protein [Nitratireductor]MBN7763697.1 hypothetical protein [Nitratireductor aquibiodomus]
MAEFMNTPGQVNQRASDAMSADGMDAFGKPVPAYRKQAALDHCRQMGLTDTNKATGVINRMAAAIGRDEPYAAMEAGMAYLDLTGTYRLLAVLCTTPPAEVGCNKEPRTQHPEVALEHPHVVYEEWGF